MNKFSLFLLIGSSVVIIISNLFYYHVRCYQRNEPRVHYSGGQFLATLIMIIIPLINILLLYFNINLQNTYWLYTSVISALSSVALTLSIFLVKVYYINIKDWFVNILILTPLLISIAGGVLFLLNSRQMSKENSIERKNLELLEYSIENVRGKFNEVDSLIENESKHIDRIFAELKNELEVKNKSLKEMQLREDELVKQTEYYKSLVSLTKDQTSAVVNTLNQNSIFELLASFIVGFISSLAVWLLSQMKTVKRIFEYDYKDNNQQSIE